MEDFSYETGPIRPPSEAGSYLVRLTRGCPWNRCGFCVTYRKEPFAVRPVEDITRDIDRMAALRDSLLLEGGGVRRPSDRYEWMVANALASGGRTAFLQDADSLSIKPDAVRAVLNHLKKIFPEIERVTTYARSHTLALKKPEDLKSFREAGLTRVHVGMETAHDPLLKIIAKGVSFDQHVEAGRKAVEAGFELSEYVMPGLGGVELSAGHAADTARALSLIDPHFIRLRTLCLHPKMALAKEFGEGGLTRLEEAGVVAEIRDFIAGLNVTRSTLASDHILNLLGELNGALPKDKENLLAVCDRFLALSGREKMLFQAGRRAGRLERLGDLANPSLRAQAEAILEEIGEENIEEAVRQATARFI